MTNRYKITISFVILLFIFSFTIPSFSVEKAGEKKATAKKAIAVEKTLSKDEALSLLKEVAPDIKILEVRTSPVKGLWEVDIESGGRKGILYIDSSKKYMIQGAIFDLKAKANLTQERFIEINKVDISQIPLDDAIVMGDKEAKHRVIVFDDPE